MTRRAVLTWMFLVCATLATFWIAESHAVSVQWALPIVLLIALLKARMVILHYMGLTEMPRAWRVVFEVWVVVVPLGILAFWLASGGFVPA